MSIFSTILAMTGNHMVWMTWHANFDRVLQFSDRNLGFFFSTRLCQKQCATSTSILKRRVKDAHWNKSARGVGSPFNLQLNVPIMDSSWASILHMVCVHSLYPYFTLDSVFLWLPGDVTYALCIVRTPGTYMLHLIQPAFSTLFALRTIHVHLKIYSQVTDWLILSVMSVKVSNTLKSLNTNPLIWNSHKLAILLNKHITSSVGRNYSSIIFINKH